MQQASQPLTALQTRQTALQSQVTTFDTLAHARRARSIAPPTLGDLDAVSTTSAGTSSDRRRRRRPPAPAPSPATTTSSSTSSRARRSRPRPRPRRTRPRRSSRAAARSPSAASRCRSPATSRCRARGRDQRHGRHRRHGRRSCATGADSLSPRAHEHAPGAANAFTITNASRAARASRSPTRTTTASPATRPRTTRSGDRRVAARQQHPGHGQSNTFEDVVPGVTLTAARRDPAATIRVDVAPDSSGARRRRSSVRRRPTTTSSSSSSEQRDGGRPAATRRASAASRCCGSCTHACGRSCSARTARRAYAAGRGRRRVHASPAR